MDLKMTYLIVLSSAYYQNVLHYSSCPYMLCKIEGNRIITLLYFASTDCRVTGCSYGYQCRVSNYYGRYQCSRSKYFSLLSKLYYFSPFWIWEK